MVSKSSFPRHCRLCAPRSHSAGFQSSTLCVPGPALLDSVLCAGDAEPGGRCLEPGEPRHPAPQHQVPPPRVFPSCPLPVADGSRVPTECPGSEQGSGLATARGPCPERLLPCGGKGTGFPPTAAGPGGSPWGRALRELPELPGPGLWVLVEGPVLGRASEEVGLGSGGLVVTGRASWGLGTHSGITRMQGAGRICREGIHSTWAPRGRLRSGSHLVSKIRPAPCLSRKSVLVLHLHLTVGM